jgi:hypothetical protein
MVGLFFTQRLVLRHAQRDEVPSLHQLVELLMERANRLGRWWGDGEVCAAAVQQRLLQAAASALPLRGVPKPGYVDRALPSKGIRSNGWVGLLAYLLTPAAAHELQPLLALGRWLHVGEHTTLGAGHYRLLAEVFD